MSLDTNKLNETEIIYPSELDSTGKKLYNDFSDKNFLENKYYSLNKSNILLNALKDFTVRYDLDDRKIMHSKKFILSFDDLISLVKFSLEFQTKINDSLNLKDYLNEITQDFINNLSYFIFSYEKIDTSKNNQNIQNNQNNYYTNYNTFNDNGSNKKKRDLYQSQTFIYFNELRKNKNDTIIEKTSFLSNDKLKKDSSKNTKTYFKQNNNSLSPLNKTVRKPKKREVITRTKRFNKSVEKRRTALITDSGIKEINNRKGKINNNNSEKRRLTKDETIPENKSKNSISIYSVCENLKASNSLLKSSKSRKLSCTEINNNKINMNNNYNFNTKKDNKVVYYDQKMNIGVKKQIISNNVIRPSNMANKLLQKGIKYITEFKDIKKEEETKKRNIKVKIF